MRLYIILILLVAESAFAQSNRSNRILNEWLILLNPSRSSEIIQSLNLQLNNQKLFQNIEFQELFTITKRHDIKMWAWIKFPQGVSVREQKQTLERAKTDSQSIDLFEPNQLVRKLSMNSISNSSDFIPPDSIPLHSIPNDTHFEKQWWIHNTGQIDPPYPGQENPPSGTPGADLDILPLWERGIYGVPQVVVAVIDTGVDETQPDLKAAIYLNPGESGALANNKKDDDGNGKIDDVSGWNFISNSNHPYDDDAHGTHVSGIIAAQHNAVGIAGIAPGLKILPIKFLDAKGSGTLKGAIEAIDYASRMKAQLLNNSWGGVEYSKALEDVIRLAGERGSLFVAAAGNAGKSIDQSPVYPASYDLPNVLTVSATSPRDKFANFSNTGKRRVHVSAPGLHIFSSLPNQSWGYMSGTSMACPAVVAVAGLVWSQNPSLHWSEIKKRVIQSSDLIPALKGMTQSWGRVNANRAVFGPFNGQPDPDLLQWQEQSYLLESLHPYLPNSKLLFRIEVPGAKAIRIHFTQHYVEESFDKLMFVDSEGNELQDFYGTKKDIWTKPIRSSFVNLLLQSDESNEYFGFAIDRVQVAYSDDW